MAKRQGFPTGYEYQEAVQHPERCFTDPTLRSASLERMAMGLPKMISGNFASVFPMTSHSGHRYAVKCFTREAPHQLQRYMIIGAYLNQMKPWWATDFKFIPEGIHVEGSPYPILRMNWVSGQTLTNWLSNHTRQPVAISSLASRFDELVNDLANSGMAHGDLQSGNLLVADNGALHLVDYDGMYVPGLERVPAAEVGHPDYQSPGRSQADYGPGMDRFSAWLISLSLKILSIDPGLLDRLNPNHDDYLLLNRSDFVDLAASPRFSALSTNPDKEIRILSEIARDILSLPLTAIPALALSASTDLPSPSSVPETTNSGLPGWMRSHFSESPSPSDEDGAVPSVEPVADLNHERTRRPVWLVRALVTLPFLAGLAAIGSWPIGLAIFLLVSLVVVTWLWDLYRRDPLIRKVAGLRRQRKDALLAVRSASAGVSRIDREIADTQRTLQQLTARQAKKRTAVQNDFSRRQQRISAEIDSIDKKLAQLVKQKQRTLDNRLRQVQQAYVTTQLSRATISPNQIQGFGSQLVANLRAVGIQSAADFSGVGYARNGRYTTAYFRRPSGGPVHVPGIGEVKAQRIDQWRQLQFVRAMASQPSSLPAADIRSINAQFATEERELQERRTRAIRSIADQIAAIQQELTSALADVDAHFRTEQDAVNEHRGELAAQLAQAHSEHLSTQQQLLGWDARLKAVPRPSLAKFVGEAIMGR
jgi:phage host-nuclease inhibitor protein Gam